MTAISKPDYTYAWAAGGSLATPSNLKIGQGWVVEVPPLQYFNWIDNRQDSFIQHVNQGGLPEWDATTVYINNYSYVKRNGLLYKCLADSVGNDPATSPTYWQPFMSGLTVVTASASLAFGSIGAGQSATNTITTTGGSVGDTVVVASNLGSFPTGCILQATMSSANTVLLSWTNISATSQTIPTATYRVDVWIH